MKKFAFLFFFIFGLQNIEFAQPIISSFSPSSGQVGTTVIISGANFNTTLANNIVFFGATKATVTSANTTSLTVSVPVGASYQPISVTNLTTGLTTFSTQPFNVTFPCGGSISLSNTNSFFGGYGSIGPSGGAPLGIVTGDLDGDGKTDVVNITNGLLGVHRNTSTIGVVSFAYSPGPWSGVSSPAAATIGDFDRDGKLDLAVVLNVSGTGSVTPDPGQSGNMGMPGLGNKQIAKMAAEQTAIRQRLEQLKNELNKDGKGSGNKLNPLINELEKQEKDLINKNFTPDMVKRQKDILTRLLESEKALMERGFEEKRESKDGKNLNYGNQIRFDEYTNQKLKQIELLRSVDPVFRKYYKDKANEYFNRAN